MASTTSHSTTSHSTADTQPTSSDTRPHLLLLPRELREMIYDLCNMTTTAFIEQPQELCRDVPERTEDFHVGEANECIRNYLALSGTCRQTYQESRIYFYGNNTFLAWVIGPQSPPLDKMDSALQHMKHVVLVRYDAKCPGPDSNDKRLPSCALDLRFRGVELQADVIVQPPDDIGFFLERWWFKAVLPKGFKGCVVTAELQADVEGRIEGAVERLRTGLQKEGCVTRGMMRELMVGVDEAW
ncbi:hypothetical protein LTR27_000807 [Elasticomyces elasticus]|nr:hypothetical protein LTR27_000807 [Elasticomyces elasticus]